MLLTCFSLVLWLLDFGRMTPTCKKRSANASETERPSTRRCLEDSPKYVIVSDAVTQECTDSSARFGSEILKVCVGKGADSQTFKLHKDIAIKSSDFLAAATMNGWKEAKRGTLKLPEETPDAFEIFEAFMYTGRIFSHKDDDDHIDNDGVTHNREWSRLSATWLLGERLQASALRDAVIDALIDKIAGGSIPTGLDEDIYKGSVRRSPMKELLVDIAIWDWAPKHLVRLAESVSDTAYLSEIAIKQALLLEEGKSPKAPYAQGSTCKYHEHGDDKPCYKTVFE